MVALQAYNRHARLRALKSAFQHRAKQAKLLAQKRKRQDKRSSKLSEVLRCHLPIHARSRRHRRLAGTLGRKTWLSAVVASNITSWLQSSPFADYGCRRACRFLFDQETASVLSCSSQILKECGIGSFRLCILQQP